VAATVTYPQQISYAIRADSQHLAHSLAPAATELMAATITATITEV
jgi:hypothetical protein